MVEEEDKVYEKTKFLEVRFWFRVMQLVTEGMNIVHISLVSSTFFLVGCHLVIV